MSKLLLLGAIVFIIGVIAAFAAFKFLPSGADLTTGAVAGIAIEKSAEETNLTKLAEGMTKAQVLELVGEPLERQPVTASGENLEYWYYANKDDVYQVAILNGKIATIKVY